MSSRKSLFIHLFIAVLLVASIGLFAKQSQSATSTTDNLSRAFTETAPPTGPVRPVGEFEPASHVLIRYPLGIPLALVVHLSNTAQVITIVSSSSVQSQATSSFQSAGVNMANVSFMIAPTDSYWTRDFGPWFIFDGSDHLGVVDFRYNRASRPNDDAVPSAFASYFNIDYYGMSLYQTGGNYMTDGISTAAQTQIAYTENSNMSAAQIGAKMQSYLGITNYYVVQDPNDTYIDHIDCWGKFLAPDKVLIRSVPTTHSQYAEIEQTAAFFASQTNAWGYPYRVYRVNTPQNQPYTNSLILNNKVFVPIMSSTYDSAALQVYRDALPGYEVIGVTGGSAVWESTDALHCRTHEIPDQDMLFISHTPLHGTQNSSSSLDFTATIKALSMAPVYSDSLFVSYKINRGAWERLPLVNIGSSLFTAVMPAQAPGDTIRYFIHAADQSGRSISHPYFAALDPHIFYIAPDVVAPEIQHIPLTTITNQEQPIVFSSVVNDNFAVTSVTLECRIDDQPVMSFGFSNSLSDTWYCEYYTQFQSSDSVFSYRIVAADNSNPANISYYPSGDSWISVPIAHTANADEIIPAIAVALKNVYPNPWKPAQTNQVKFDYSAPAGAIVAISIYNVKGQKVAEIAGESKFSGMNRISWNGKCSSGNNATPGLYVVRFKLNDVLSTQKLIIVN